MSPTDIFVPLAPALVVGIVIVLLFAWRLGVGERNRLAALALNGEAPANLPTGGFAIFGRMRSPGNVAGQGTSGRGFDSFEFSNPGARETLADSDSSSAAAFSAGASSLPAMLTETVLDPGRATLRPKLFWFNFVLTVVVLVMLVLDLVPLAFVFMIGSAVAILVNFPKLKQQSERIVAHSSSIVAVVSMVLGASVLIAVLNGTGMVGAMANWLVAIIPASLGGSLAVITGILSIPMTFFMSNDAFYFGILPVLTESAANFGISPVQMARASVIGQPVHLQSPLVPAILLLVSLASVNLGDHHRKVLWRAVVVSLVMLVVGVITAAIPW